MPIMRQQPLIGPANRLAGKLQLLTTKIADVNNRTNVAATRQRQFERARGDRLSLKENSKARLLNAIAAFMARRDAREAQSKAREQQRGIKGIFGSAGSLAGAGVGALLAPATGGASAALAGASLGAGIGGTAGNIADAATYGGYADPSALMRGMGEYAYYRSNYGQRSQIPDPTPPIQIDAPSQYNVDQASLWRQDPSLFLRSR